MLSVTWMPPKVTGMDYVCLPLLAKTTPCSVTSYWKPEQAELQVWPEPGLESSFRNCSLPDIAPVNTGLCFWLPVWMQMLEAPGGGEFGCLFPEEE